MFPILWLQSYAQNQEHRIANVAKTFQIVSPLDNQDSGNILILPSDVLCNFRCSLLSNNFLILCKNFIRHTKNIATLIKSLPNLVTVAGSRE